ATDSVPNRRTRKVCEFLGEISFPLYITHYPLIYIQMAWANEHADAPISTHVFVSVALFLVAIAMAYACSRLYDIPVRKWLKNKLFAK
ncbi:MAG: acyltransferase family protein, partial [Candidatus Limisoma sp.]